MKLTFYSSSPWNCSAVVIFTDKNSIFWKLIRIHRILFKRQPYCFSKIEISNIGGCPKIVKIVSPSKKKRTLNLYWKYTISQGTVLSLREHLHLHNSRVLQIGMKVKCLSGWSSSWWPFTKTSPTPFLVHIYHLNGPPTSLEVKFIFR